MTKKINKDNISPGIFVIQSLERLPSLLNNKDWDIKVLLYSHNNSDQAVKNLQIEGPEGFHVDETLQEMDSYQLRKYFDDQQIIVDFIESQFEDNVSSVDSFNSLSETIASLQQAESQPAEPRRVNIIIPIGIPGLGKTYFCDNVLRPSIQSQDNVLFKCISNDQVRLDMIDEYMQEHSGAKQEDALINSRDQLQNKLEQLIIEYIDDFIENEDEVDNSEKQLVIYIDKNHTLNTLERFKFFINAIQTHLQDAASIKKTLLVPEFQCHTHSQDGFQYPFPLQMLLTCFLRLSSNPNHSILGMNDPGIALRVVFGFFNSFKNIRFDEEFLRSNDLDECVKVNLTNDDKDVQLPKNLAQAMIECLKVSQKYQATPQEEPEFTRLIALLEKYRAFFGALDESVL